VKKTAKRKNPYKGRDTWGQKAKDEGYEARSVYKLEEIQRRFRLLRPGQRVLDLGCFPGSWSRYAYGIVGGKGRIVGIDLQQPLLTGPTWIVGSILEVPPETIAAALGGPADVVLSDMAPNTMGDRDSDHLQQIELARCALSVAVAVGGPGSAFVCKVFEGREAKDFEMEARKVYGHVKRVRPEAVRKVSREWFLVAEDKKPEKA
jgi:23S rRNA (uridine2552-2'-O)-methyltransferase